MVERQLIDDHRHLDAAEASDRVMRSDQYPVAGHCDPGLASRERLLVDVRVRQDPLADQFAVLEDLPAIGVPVPTGFLRTNGHSE